LISLGVGRREQQQDADQHGISALMIIEGGLLLIVTAREAARLVNDLGERSENLDLRNVWSFGVFGELFRVRGQESSRGLIIALTKDKSIV
jgi:hypothetical protein